MLKFIRGKSHQTAAEKQKLQNELFAFRKTVTHGFPNKPTSFAWDPKLNLLAIGTSSGAIRILGMPGVEFAGQHANHDDAVVQLTFVPEAGRVISVCDDNTVHLWEINGSSLDLVSSQSLEGKLKKISATTITNNGKQVLLGTEGGNIYPLNIEPFEFSKQIIYQDIIMQAVPEDYKLNPGAVEAIAEQPFHSNVIVIGYNRGLMVLWDRESSTAIQTFTSTQQLESICWRPDGKQLLSSHNDGSYAQWDAENGGQSNEPVTIYGPFPCKAVTKILVPPSKTSEEVLILAGGMPRASYSDRNTITVHSGKRQVCFDFTSKVIDFFVIPESESIGSLIVLLEEEIIAIDLDHPEWRMIALPYLVSLHASAVTCAHHVPNVSVDLWKRIEDAGVNQTKHLYSDRPWPITGGILDLDEITTAIPDRRELLLTGHEDGTVRFWDAGQVAMRPLLNFSSSQAFHTEDEINGDISSTGNVDDEDIDDEWPPFRKVGMFDPYSDDPRLAVKKIALCPKSGTLAVAGTAGSILLAQFSDEAGDKELEATSINIVSDRDGFIWKGHEQLAPKTGSLSIQAGFQPWALVQLHPPAAITALALHADWRLIAAGTAHGLAVFDYAASATVLAKCTLNPNDLSGAGDAPISRRKSFKKSLRESFRRLRKGRSQRHTTSPTSPTSPQSVASQSMSVGGGGESGVETRPVERQIEARPVDDSLGSMVRCLAMARTYLVSVNLASATLWAGTNNGSVLVFAMTVPSAEKRASAQGDAAAVAATQCRAQLAKEIQLKHRAPVIALSFLDADAQPLKITSDDQIAPPPHRVLICSEEQFKVFALPTLRPVCKFKLTVQEGARLRRAGLVGFRPTTGSGESCHLVALTNLGDCIVLGIPELRRQLNAAVVRREDIAGIGSFTLGANGEAFYLHSSSELQRVTLSASRVTRPRCHVSIASGIRSSSETNDEDDENDDGDDVDDDDNNEDDDNENEASESESSSASEANQDENNQQGNKKSTNSTRNGVLSPQRPDSQSSENTSKKEASPSSKRENGCNTSTTSSSRLETSAADITIDSVKDHLLNSGNSLDDSTTAKMAAVSLETPTTDNNAEILVVSSATDPRPPRTNLSLNKAPLAKMED